MTIKGMAEFALRVSDLAKMRAFYRDVVGLEVFDDSDPELFVFFKIADAVEGHPQVFALFDRKSSPVQEHTTLDHFAFLIDMKDYEAHRERLERSGVDLFPKTFPQFHWRSLFFYDPEGNLVELVCYDPGV